MAVNILIYVTNELEVPISNGTVDFYANVTLGPTFTTTTDGTGHASMSVDPGSYVVKITNGLTVRNMGRYVVKASIPHHFSGIEMIYGEPDATDGPFKPRRFRNTKYEHSEIAKTTQLVQKANWRIRS